MRVLVVEDQQELAETVATGLRREGMAVDVALDGGAALAVRRRSTTTTWSCSTATSPVHGDRVCATLVERGARARVLMLTASAGIEDRVVGSASAPTTTCRSRSRSPSWSRGSGRSPGGRSRRCRRS